MKKFCQRFLPATLTICLIPSAHAQSICNAVLDKLQNELHTASQHGTRVALRDRMCQSSQSSQGSGSSVGGSVGYGGFSLGLQSDSQRFSDLKTNYCSDNSKDLSQSDFEWLTRKVASEAVLSAWLKCLNRGGLNLDVIEVGGNEVLLTALWQATGGVTSVPVSSFDASGAQCSSPFAVGQNLIAGLPVYSNCTRSGGPALLILAVKNSAGAEAGSQAAILPPLTRAPSDEDKCVQGDAAACLNYSINLDSGCGNPPPNPLPGAPVQPATPAQLKMVHCFQESICWRGRAMFLAERNSRCAPGRYGCAELLNFQLPQVAAEVCESYGQQ